MVHLTRMLWFVGPAALSASAFGTITPIGQFSGVWSESFESFHNYQQGPLYQQEEMIVMGGNASIDSLTDQLAVYEPSVGATFYIGHSGFAQVADGTKALGLDTFGSSWSITFSSDVLEFGAFWGAYTSYIGPTTVSVKFFGSNNSLIDSTTFAYDHFILGDGGLDWNGWRSDVAFRSVRVSAGLLVVDGMQASNAVPEPASLTALGFASVVALRRRRSARHR